MNDKMIKHNVLGLALALAVTLPAQAANESHGLRVVAVHGYGLGRITLVEARISRTLANRVLSPQRLRVAIVAADGTVRAERQRLVGPAQMTRGSARETYLTTQLEVLAAPQDRLVGEWVTTTL